MKTGFDFNFKQDGPVAQKAEIKLNGIEVALTGYKIEGYVGELTQITLSGYVDKVDFEATGITEDQIEINGAVYVRKDNKNSVMDEIKKVAV